MDLPSAGQLALSLMNTHGLVADGWTFRFNQRKRTLGLCHFTARRIELSAPFVTRNDEPEVRDVILHEIAHALTPPPEAPPKVPPEVSTSRSTSKNKGRAGFGPHGFSTTDSSPSISGGASGGASGGTSGGEAEPYRPHGPAWQAACIKIGANPNRLNTTAATPAGKWRAVCPGCQTTHHRHRKPAKGRTYLCKACGPTSGRLAFRRVG